MLFFCVFGDLVCIFIRTKHLVGPSDGLATGGGMWEKRESFEEEREREREGSLPLGWGTRGVVVAVAHSLRAKHFGLGQRGNGILSALLSPPSSYDRKGLFLGIPSAI